MIHEFGPFRYDAAQRLLFRSGEMVPLAPKAVDTLHVLLERRGAVVEKADLMKLVWPDTTVEEVGLARNVSLLRKALGDEAEEYIETIPRRRIGFAAAAPAPVPAPPAREARAGKRLAMTAALGAVALAALGYYLFYVPSRYVPQGRQAAIAVVPFECLCPGMDGERFSRGLNEAMVAGLSRRAGVQVVSPSTVARYRRVGMSMAWMGRLLGLEVLVEGTVERLDGRMRITSRLVDVHTGRVIWSEAKEETAGDLGQVQSSVGSAVAEGVGKLLAGGRS
ncbi:MAG TPA: hypothetical protein DEH78_20485 [Solibacterales bacterium]|nr:hypothetical protein [Bryobacterales bacterium]